ncbi:hypothetical protein [Spirosoma montaniterrae]|uniref:hypothetical protein n=1 Tax=Spirosoma montaniterrae TaxID=1178516 RepID=UPI0012F7E22D|nr:hypothetical protein [Spirosoma montaniterrae]
MKKKLAQLADALLSREEAKAVKGGNWGYGGGTGGGCSCGCMRVGNMVSCSGGLPPCSWCTIH